VLGLTDSAAKEAYSLISLSSETGMIEKISFLRTAKAVLLLALAGPLLAACVTSGKPAAQTTSAAVAAAPPAGEARLFFYREKFALLGAIEPDVVVNDKRVGTSRAGEAFYRDALPGRYQIYTSHNPDHVVEVRVEAGEEAFIKVEARLQSLNSKLTAVLMDPQLGAQEMEELILIEPSLSNADS
jgi:hypothetical protein